MIPDNFKELSPDEREAVWMKALEEHTPEELGMYKVFTDERGVHYPMSMDTELGEMVYPKHKLLPYADHQRHIQENKHLGLEYDYATKTYVPKYTYEEAADALRAIDNRISTIVNRTRPVNLDDLDTSTIPRTSQPWVGRDQDLA